MRSLERLHGSTLYLDANVFIYAFEGPPGPVRGIAAQLLRDVHSERCEGATSVVTRAEVLVRPLRMKQVELADRYRALLSGTDALALHVMDENVADRAAELRADYPVLKLPDAMHIATAMLAGCDAFVTGDVRLSIVSARIAVLTLDQLQSA